MKIAYIGRVSLSSLVGTKAFDVSLPMVRWGFPFGSEIVNRLVARGHEVHVVTEHLVDRIQKYSAGRLTVWLVPCRKKSRWSFLTLFSKEVRGIVECINAIRPDVVFAQWTYHNAYAGLKSGFPLLVVAHDSPWEVAKTFRTVATTVKAIYAQIVVFPCLKHITAVSPHIEEDLRRLNRYKGEISVIPNGIDLGTGERSTGGAKIKTRRDARTIVCVSQWGRLKNTKILVRAFEDLRKKHNDWRLILIGQGLREGFSSENKKGRARLDGVEFRGYLGRETIDRVLSEEADVFCSPSLEESFGMVFVEAMRHGVPCIGGQNSGAVPWVIGDGGATCDVSDPKELAECIENVMVDVALRKKMSEGGISRVRELFNIEYVVDRYVEELKRVSEGRRVCQ